MVPTGVMPRASAASRSSSLRVITLCGALGTVTGLPKASSIWRVSATAAALNSCVASRRGRLQRNRVVIGLVLCRVDGFAPARHHHRGAVIGRREDVHVGVIELVDQGLVDHLTGRAHSGDAAVVEGDDFIAVTRGHAQVVNHDQYGATLTNDIDRKST